MKTILHIAFILGVIGPALASTTQGQTAPFTLPADEQVIINMISGSMDMLGETEIKNRDQLIAWGEKIYPLLKREVLNSNNRFKIGSIIEIFVYSNGDKTYLHNVLKELLAKHQGDSYDDLAIRVTVQNALEFLDKEVRQPATATSMTQPTSSLVPPAPVPSRAIANSTPVAPPPPSARWPWLVGAAALLAALALVVRQLRRR